MEQFQTKYKKLNLSYKIILGIALFAIVFAVFNALGNKSTQATPQATTPLHEIETPETEPNNAISNIQQGDQDLAELTTAVGGVDSNASTGSVLPASTSADSVGIINKDTYAYKSNKGFWIYNIASLQEIMIGYGGGESTDTAQSYIVPPTTGAIPGLINLTGTLYEEKPASVEVWANDIKQKIDPTAYAQSSSDSNTYNPGQGYELLSPIRDLWRASVNLVYVLYILIVVFLAFLILFRSQLGGQEAITLFNAIPSLVISLILVYFSYPVSALFIDFISVGSGVTYGALIGNDANSGAPGSFLYEQDFVTGGGNDAVSNIINNVVGTERINPNTDLQIDDKYVNVWFIFQTSGISPTTDDIETIVPRDVPLANIIGNFIESIAGTNITDSLLKLVFTFAAFSASLKLFFSLMRSYVFLIVLPMVSPFIFLVAAIPSQTNSIISQYFGRLLAASLSFIAVYAVFLVIIIIARDTTHPDDILWVPPLLGYSAEQAISGTTVTNIARPLIGYALFISTPMIPDYIYELFQASNQSPFVDNLRDSTKQAGRTVLGFGGAGFQQMQSALNITPQER